MRLSTVACLLLSTLSILFEHGNGEGEGRDVKRQDQRVQPRQPGPLRNITVVCDVQQIGALEWDSDEPQIVEAAHTFLLVEGTGADGPLRIETVSAMLDGVSQGLAIAVTEYTSDARANLFDLDAARPAGTARKVGRVIDATRLSNIEIFDPSSADEADGARRSVVMDLWLRNAFGNDWDETWYTSINVFGPSHRFLWTLLRLPPFEVILDKLGDVVNDAMRSADRWGRLHRVQRVHSSGEVDPTLYEEIGHIFYEAVGHPKLRGQRPIIVRAMFELNKSADTVYTARRVTDKAWQSNICPACYVHPPGPNRPVKTQYHLSRDPTRTLDALSWVEAPEREGMEIE